MMLTLGAERSEKCTEITNSAAYFSPGTQNVQRRDNIGRITMSRLVAAALVLALHLQITASSSSLSFQNQTISSSPVVYACGFYTMSYKIWCETIAVTSYVAIFSDCGISSPSSAQNGGSSALQNSSTTVLPSGLIAAPSCPPASAFAQSMSCSLRPACTVAWPGPDSNTEALCLLLLAGPSGGNIQVSCDLSIEGQTSPPLAAGPASDGLKDMKWWQVLLIVVAGVGTLLVGILLLLCLWRYCCRRRSPHEGGGDAGSTRVVPPLKNDFSMGLTKPAILGHGSGAAAAAAAATGGTAKAPINPTALPSEIARMPPAAVLRMYSHRLRDTAMDNPNLFVPDDKEPMKLSQHSAAQPLATISPPLPGAVPRGHRPPDTPNDGGLVPDAQVRAPPQTADELNQPATASPDLSPDADLVAGARRDYQTEELAAAPQPLLLPAQPPAAAPHLPQPPPPSPPGGANPQQTSPPPLQQAPLVHTSGPYEPTGYLGTVAAAASATPAGGAVAASGLVIGQQQPQQQQQQQQPQQQQQQQKPPVGRSTSLFARLFSKSRQPSTTASDAAGVSGSGPGVGSSTGNQLQVPQLESTSRGPMSSLQPQASGMLQPPLQPSQLPQPNVQASAAPWQGPGQGQSSLQPVGVAGAFPPPALPSASSFPSPSQAQIGMALGNKSMHHVDWSQQQQLQSQLQQRQPSAAFGGSGGAGGDGVAPTLQPVPYSLAVSTGDVTRQASRSNIQQQQWEASSMMAFNQEGYRSALSQQTTPAQQRQQQDPDIMDPVGRPHLSALQPQPPEPLRQPDGNGDEPAGPMGRSAFPSSHGNGDSMGTLSRQPSLQPLQPLLRPPARNLQPLQPLQPLRSMPLHAETGIPDSGPENDLGLTHSDRVAPNDETVVAPPTGPRDATPSLDPPQGFPAPLPLLQRTGGLAPLGGQGGGGLPLPLQLPRPGGGLAPLAPLPGPRKLVPTPRRTDVDDDDDDHAGMGFAGGTSLRGEPSFGDEQAEVKRRGGGGGDGGNTGGGLEDLEDNDEDLDLDRPAPPRRGGLF